MNKKTSRFVLLSITYAIGLYFALHHLKEISVVLQFLWKVIFPLILGGCIAFILSLPMNAIEGLLEKHLRNPKILRFKRGISLLSTLVLFFCSLILLFFLVIPELVNSFNIIAQQLPVFLDEVNRWISQQDIEWSRIEDYIKGLEFDWDKIKQSSFLYAKNLGGNIFSSAVNIVKIFFSGMTTFLLGLIFSLYILLSKEKIAAQILRFLYALLPEETVEEIRYVMKLSHSTFASFFSSQCLEALILGGMFFVSMLIFKMPYALLISIVISVTALVPIVGSFIGMVFGAFLILMVSPMQALWFVVLFLILQQIEGNLIYPIVVGSSVGLPSLWVLLAVLIGNGLMGILGMIIFIPIFSIAYELTGKFIEKRLRARNISAERIGDET